jgi:hypothetical protein
MVARGTKAFRVDGKGRLRFLFHAHQGSSVVPLDRWIETKRPWVTDGSRQKMYRAAFHFLRDRDRVEKFDRLTQGKYVMIPIKAQGAERKPRTNVGSWLARKIFVSSVDVEKILAEATHEQQKASAPQGMR